MSQGFFGKRMNVLIVWHSRFIPALKTPFVFLLFAGYDSNWFLANSILGAGKSGLWITSGAIRERDDVEFQVLKRVKTNVGPWALTLIVFLFSTSMSLADVTEQYSWTFDDVPAGKLPHDFRESGKRGPHWGVIETDRAVSRPNVLATGKPYGATRHRTMILANQRMGEGDAELSVSFLIVTSHEGAAGGLIWLAQDEQNYYLFQVSPLGKNNLALYRVVNGVRNQLDAATHPFGRSEWHTLWLVVLDDRFVATLDGRPVLDARDKTFNQGQFGVWSSGVGLTYFDNLSLKKLK